MKDIDVLVIGRSCVDYIAVTDKYPAEDQKIPLEYRLTEAGGQGSTAACCISRLGGRTIYIGNIGDDDEGKFCLKRLEDYNVAADHVEIIRGGKTPVAYIMVTKSTGKRTIIYEPGALPLIKMDNAIIELINKSRIILLDPQVTYLAGEIKSSASDDIKIVYDCERWRHGINDMMKLADYFVPSSDFFNTNKKLFTGDTLFENIFLLNSEIDGSLIVTAGERGAYYISGNILYHTPPPDITIKDTIGAGDNFHAAFALAVSMDFDIHRSVKLAVSAASLSCREHGGRTGIPGFEEAVRIADNLTHIAV